MMDRPNAEQVRQELERVQGHRTWRRTLKSTIYVLVTVAAFAILVATLWMPVLEVYGGSMNPTLDEGNLVAAVKTGSFRTGDVIAFYYNNKILVKRVIAGPGDWVDIDKDGTVTVNGTVLEEPYVDEVAYGDTNIELPYQVPEGRWFVMGDHRSVSVDSRNKAVGPVASEQVVGRLVYTIWPLSDIGTVS